MPTMKSILKLAAKKYLWDGKGQREIGKEEYSCNAAYAAWKELKPDYEFNWIWWEQGEKELKALGCPTDSPRAFYGFKYKSQEEKQIARSLWLLIAAEAVGNKRI